MKRYIEDVNHKLKIHETLSTEFLEELLARLVIFQLLSCAFGLSAGVAISALLVGAAHLHNPNAAILGVLYCNKSEMDEYRSPCWVGFHIGSDLGSACFRIAVP